MHIPAIVPLKEQPAYRNRKGTFLHNVMVVVSFDRIFQFVTVGWEGSASDMRMLRWSIDTGDFVVPEKKEILNLNYFSTD
ncbi:hypothetical protein AXF42_Ash005018 [Apostasia shenzhenica]|uniref:DDE Tnp4 domain-containing protein n=1 Tax=Apostasia shenzhenica TaxID=1088818 RepID=A0A2I0B884_9ASPA|nr:hypothetical protein AXF42_Ash005018 [Apostasia shenzhenica]